MLGISKKNVALLILCSAFIVGIYIYQRPPSTKALTKDLLNNTVPFPNNIDSITNKISSIDTDSDGLKDWEETLWKTDPKNPDTDADGTNDSEEITLSRDPKVAGPDDNYTPEKKPKDEFTATNKLAQDSFNKLFEAKKSGVPLSEKEIGNVLKDLLINQKDKIIPKFYSIKDIIIDSTESVKNIRQFGNSLGQAHAKYSPQKIEHEVVLLYDALNGENNPEIMVKLENISNSYSFIAENSLKIRVPKSASQIHLKLINAELRMSAVIRTFALAYDDPAITLVGMSDYPVALEQLKVALRDLATYFETSKITYTESDPAYYLVN